MHVSFQKENSLVVEREVGIVFCLDVLDRKKNFSVLDLTYTQGYNFSS